MRLAGLLCLALLVVGCSSTQPQPMAAQPAMPRPDFSPPQDLGVVIAILDQLPRADEPPATELMVMVMAAGMSPQVHDGVLLTVWHDAERGEVWVKQAGGYPGVEIWFGPGPDMLLPTPPRVDQFAIAD